MSRSAAALLAVAGGADYQQAAHPAGRKSGDAVSQLVARFSREGRPAVEPRHGGGKAPAYGEAERQPTPEADGTATWSLNTLRKFLRGAADGLDLHRLADPARGRPDASAGPHLVPRGDGDTAAEGRHGRGHRPRRRTRKKRIEDAYAYALGGAGPLQTVPHPGAS